MGWDISYHPISETQIKEWYFDVLANPDLVNKLATEHAIEDLYKVKYAELVQPGDIGEGSFDRTHGYYIAIVQGFFGEYFYVRGGALSFSESEALQGYFKDWEKILPHHKFSQTSYSRLLENYSAGVYLPADKVQQLLIDYEKKQEIREELNDIFSHNRIAVFLKALHSAKDQGAGLLEAAEVIEPDPFNLNGSTCYSNLFNCDREGPMLYQQAALEQIAAFQKEQGVDGDEATQEEPLYIKLDASTLIDIEDEEPKKSFWSRIFGK